MNGAVPAYAALAEGWKALRSHSAFAVREVACVGAARTLIVADSGPAGAPRIAISAGVHGDEPAAPWALLSLARDGLLDSRFAYRLWACTNPSGYGATRENADGADVNRSFSGGGRTPEARAIITANRDKTFALSIDLHEDFEASGFYLYENLRSREPSFAAHIVKAVDAAAFPLQAFESGFDDAYALDADDARRCEPGCIFAYFPESLAHFRDGLPYSLYLLRNKVSDHALTFETPRALPWDRRIAIHRVAVVAAIDRLTQLRTDEMANVRNSVESLR